MLPRLRVHTKFVAETFFLFLRNRNKTRFWSFSQTFCFRDKFCLRAQMRQHCCANILCLCHVSSFLKCFPNNVPSFARVNSACFGNKVFLKKIFVSRKQKKVSATQVVCGRKRESMKSNNVLQQCFATVFPQRCYLVCGDLKAGLASLLEHIPCCWLLN